MMRKKGFWKSKVRAKESARGCVCAMKSPDIHSKKLEMKSMKVFLFFCPLRKERESCF